MFGIRALLRAARAGAAAWRLWTVGAGAVGVASSLLATPFLPSLTFAAAAAALFVLVRRPPRGAPHARPLARVARHAWQLHASMRKILLRCASSWLAPCLPLRFRAPSAAASAPAAASCRSRPSHRRADAPRARALSASASAAAQALPGLAVRVLLLFRPYRRYLARCFGSAACGAAEAALFAPRKRVLFAHLASLGDDPDVLDLGAGTGVNARLLPTNVKRLTAVEPNPEMVCAYECATGHALACRALSPHARR